MDVFPFYQKLHAFVRHRLLQYYGPEYISENDLLPAHLLGKNPLILEQEKLRKW